MNSFSNLVSIRVKNLHVDANSNPDSLSIRDFPSINKAKAHSRELGGSGKVKACKTMKEAQEIIRKKKENLNG